MRIQGRHGQTEEDEREGGGTLDSSKILKGKLESVEKMRDWGKDLGSTNNNRESTERLYDHQVLACALRALNGMSGLFLLYHKASSGHEEATWQSFLRLRCTLRL